MKKSSFLIVFISLLFTACRSSQVGRVTPSVEITPTYEIVFENTIELPPTIDHVEVPWPEFIKDPFLLELEHAWVSIAKLEKENQKLLSVQVETKPHTIYIRDTILASHFVREDSNRIYLYQEIGEDTTLLAEIEKPILPDSVKIPTDGSFPWGVTLLAMAALLVFFAKRKT